jgi:pantoate--beta-alanine ligase
MGAGERPKRAYNSLEAVTPSVGMDPMNSQTSTPASAGTGVAVARENVAVVREKSALRQALAEARLGGATIGLVPTMGFLHEGHLSLLRAAREQCDVVVISLFVNPTQFGPGEDLDRYPRDEERDLALAAEAGADLVYAPPVAEVYPEGFATHVEVDGLTEVLCGDPARRGPAHFRGVTTVVAKLFNAVDPDVAYFGQKDAQQAAVIRRMVRDLDFRVRIEVLPTVREPDGLAMSSRNAYLGPEERRRATALWRALAAVERDARTASLAAGLEAGRRELAAAGIEPEYLEARDAESLEPVAELNGRPVLVAVAARVGGARLIDNVLIRP